ncbi:unnamed protein product, partial [Polarella glacialis]
MWHGSSSPSPQVLQALAEANSGAEGSLRKMTAGSTALVEEAASPSLHRVRAAAERTVSGEPSSRHYRLPSPLRALRRSNSLSTAANVASPSLIAASALRPEASPDQSPRLRSRQGRSLPSLPLALSRRLPASKGGGSSGSSQGAAAVALKAQVEPSDALEPPERWRPSSRGEPKLVEAEEGAAAEAPSRARGSWLGRAR